MEKPIKYIHPEFFLLIIGFFFFPCIFLFAQNLIFAKYPGPMDRTRFPRVISYYRVSAAQNLLSQGHLYNKSTGTSVGINQINLGTGNIISPPFFCYPFSGQFMLFHQPVTVLDYDWYPAGTILQGTAIYGVSSGLTIIPLCDSRGILVKVTLHNTLNHEISVPAEWLENGSIGTSFNWEWFPPYAMKSKPENVHVKTNQNTLEFRNDSTVALVKSSEFKTNPNQTNSLSYQITLNSNEKKSLTLVILLGTDIDKLNKNADKILLNPEKIIFDAFDRYNKMLNGFESKAPKLSGRSPELNAFYKKGLLTFSTCRWEVPEFISSPWYAESGIDGGALNNYFWGVVYVSRLMSMIDPAAVRKLLVAYVNSDLQKTYSLNPATGKGMGVLYSYNYYSIARATYDYITITGDLGILHEKIGRETYLDNIYRFCLSAEDLKTDPELIDFGGNQNLLELKKTTGYCNFTPSPNAERLLIYRYLSDFYFWLGKLTPDNLSIRGEKLKTVFRSKLWDSENNWLYSLNSAFQPRTVFSIQIFDVLRTGVLEKIQQEAIVAHLNTREFLTEWGVHSLAKTDEGYDPADVDWGGPGVYAGDAPELIEDLFHAGFVSQGIDLLNRIIWWGQFPYYPQAIRADRIGYREDGRPNVIAGLAAPQSIIFGLFGISVGKDFVSFNPVNHSFVKGLSLTGLKIRNQKFDISIHGKKMEFSVRTGKKRFISGLGKEIIIKLPVLTGAVTERKKEMTNSGK
jgi:hypothetical protein